MTPDSAPNEISPLSDAEFERLFERAYAAYGHWASHMTPEDLVRLASGGGWRADVHETGWSGVYRRIDDGVDRAPLANLLRLNVWCETDQTGRVQLIRTCADGESPPLDDVLQTAAPLRDVRTVDLSCLPEHADEAAVNDSGLHHMTGWARMQTLTIDELRRVTTSGFEALANAKITTSLRNATLSGFDEAAAVARFLGSADRLQRIDLESDRMTDQALAGLHPCAELISLTITGGRITGEGFDAFRQSPTVHRVCLDSPAFADRGVGLVADRFPQLRELTLRSSHITDHGLQSLARLTELRQLDLAESSVTAEGLAALEKLKQLIRLSLDNTPLDDDSVSAIARLRGLRSVSLCETKITKHGVTALRRALPRCEVQGAA